MTIPFAGDVLDRAPHRRTEAAWLQRALAGAQAVVTGDGGVVLDGAAVAPAAPDGREPVAFLGERDGRAVFAVEARDGDELTDLRTAAALLPAADAGLVAYAAALRNWHRAHAFCGRCGAPSRSGEGGHVRVCANGHQVHPRTDPVVIMLVVDDERDRVLLGRKPGWPPRRFSALAGFVEPGETLEAAVAREVLEEAGVRVADVRYEASQPWPFPASLMLGFVARFESGEAAVADEELESVRWCTRAELEAASAEAPDAPVLLPPPLAIARHLVERWLTSGRSATL